MHISENSRIGRWAASAGPSLTLPGSFHVWLTLALRPSFHLAQPLIAAWYLRRWRRASWIVFGYCMLLVPAIVTLRWHYIVDLLGGLAVTAIAVWIVEASRKNVRMPAAHSYVLPHRTPTTYEAGG